jgi:hypothetical protein
MWGQVVLCPGKVVTNPTISPSAGRQKGAFFTGQNRQLPFGASAIQATGYDWKRLPVVFRSLDCLLETLRKITYFAGNVLPFRCATR